MTVDCDEDLKGLLAAGRAVRTAFDAMKKAARSGMTTADLDTIGARLLAQAGARSAPQLYYDFPGATCISVNEEAAHGIPGERVLNEGDMINIDVSAELAGYVADMGESFIVGASRPLEQRICDTVQAAVRAALKMVRAGRSLNVIGRAVQKVADHAGYKIVENLGSHGVGRSIHEEPSYVPIDNPRESRKLKKGMVLTIEPFLTTGRPWVNEQADGWTLSVAPGQLVAQFEHTLVVTDREPVIITR
ncbi:MAG: type I methionyl aminopeptidase [Proteobacteria bacterium]|nr:type I methionyl aminopeptidase [Pseudomonadota bacterium]